MKTKQYKKFGTAANRAYSINNKLVKSREELGCWGNPVSVVKVMAEEVNFEIKDLDGVVVEEGEVWLILDGQHRVYASREYDWEIPVYFNEDVVEDIIPKLIPGLQEKKSWKPIDHIKQQAKAGNNDFQMLLAAHAMWEDEKIAVGPLATAYALNSGSANTQIKDGSFVYSNKGSQIIKNCMKLKPFLGKTVQTQYFIDATKSLMSTMKDLDYKKIAELFKVNPALTESVIKLTNSNIENKKKLLRLYALTIPSQGDARQASGELYDFVVTRSGGGCQNPTCGNEGEAVDHYVPHSKGGETDVNNLIHLCTSCNSSYRDREKDFDNPNIAWSAITA